MVVYWWRGTTNDYPCAGRYQRLLQGDYTFYRPIVVHTYRPCWFLEVGKYAVRDLGSSGRVIFILTGWG